MIERHPNCRSNAFNSAMIVRTFIEVTRTPHRRRENSVESPLESREGPFTILVSKDLEHFVHDAIGPSFTDADRDDLVQPGDQGSDRARCDEVAIRGALVSMSPSMTVLTRHPSSVSVAVAIPAPCAGN
jgi:hypothetical protein